MKEPNPQRSRRVLLTVLGIALIVLIGGTILVLDHTKKTAVPEHVTAVPQQTVVPAVASEPEPEPVPPPKPTMVKISYPNGKTRAVEVDDQNSVLSYTDNKGFLWKFEPPQTEDEHNAQTSQNVWHRYRADGSRIVGTDWFGTGELKDDQSVVLTGDDGVTTTFAPTGATITTDKDGAITSIQYPDGSSREFDREGDSNDINLVEETDSNGVEKHLKQFGTDDDGNAVFHYCHVEGDECKPTAKAYTISLDTDTAVFTVTDKEDGVTTVHYTSGLTTRSTQEK